MLPLHFATIKLRKLYMGARWVFTFMIKCRLKHVQLLGILSKREHFDKFRKHNYNSEKKEERVFFKNKLQ